MAWGRRALRALAILAVLLIGLTLALVIVTQTPWFRERLRRLAVRQAAQAIQGELRIGAIEGSLFGGVALRDVAVVQGDVTVAKVARVELDYSLGDLIGAGHVVNQLVIDAPVVEAVRTADGWNVARLLKPRDPKPDSPRATFALADIRVTNGRVVVREVGVPETAAIPRVIEGLTFDGGVSSSPAELSVDVRRLTFRAGQPELDLRSLAGRIVNDASGWRFESLAVRTGESAVDVDGRLTRADDASPWRYDLDVSGQPVSLPEVGRLVRAADFPLHPRLGIKVTGTTDALGLDVDVRESEAGKAKGTLTLGLGGRQTTLGGDLAVTDVTLEPILKSPDAAGRITGRTTFALRFPSASAGAPVDGTFTFEGPAAGAYGYEASAVKVKGSIDGRRVRLDGSANAYGGQATVAGTITQPGAAGDSLALDLTGRVAHVDLRRLPASLQVPTLESDLSGTYQVQGALPALTANATLEESTLEGALLHEGTSGRFARTTGGFTFGAAGTVAGLDIQRLGRVFDVEAMAAPRLAGAVNGSFEVEGEQRGRAGLALHAIGTLTDSTLFDGRLPSMDVDVRLDGARLEARTKGRVEGVDLAIAADTPSLTGRLSGLVDATVVMPDTGRVDLDSVSIDGRVTLGRTTILDVPFTEVSADVSMSDGIATVKSLDARGDGFTLTGHGQLGLGEGDASDFRFKLDADSLVQPARVADLPITGAAITEGHITGTREDFLITGTVAGDQVAYADVAAAETVTAQYAVRLPDFDVERLDVQASVDAEQVTVAGQMLPSVDGTVGYAARDVRFDVTGTDGVRDLAARGTLTLEEQGQRLLLDRLEASREGVRWALAPDTVARVDITSRQATLVGVALANGAQRVDAEGTIGIQPDATSSLRLTATAVDVGDALVLAGQTFDADGTLELTATLGGTRELPLVDGVLELTQGRVRNMDIQRFGGRLNYDGALAFVDLELVKDATARLTAKGIIPRTILDERTPEHVAATASDKLDVAIVSTPIDLALAEGVSPYVTKLGGVARVDVRLSGSGRDPHVEGDVQLTDGTFFLPSTGVTYRDLDARLEFQDERVSIAELGVETGRGDRLTATGELGLGRSQGSSVNLRLEGHGFRVVDNHYGQLDLDTDLTVSGTLLAPVVEGQVSVAGGRLELDEILPQVATNTYATQAEYQGIPTDRLRGAIVPDVLGPDEREPALAPGRNTFTIPAANGDVEGEEADGVSNGGSTETAEPTPSAFANAALNIQVRIPDNLVLRGTDIEAARASIGDLNATLGGDFRVAKTAGKATVLLGNVNTVRGTYSYQGRQFEIVRDGQITFRGTETINPQLDITGQRTIQGVEARIRIQGTARRPEVSFSSNPPLDEGDILALIIFNQPLNQLGTGEQASLAQRAGGIAAGFVVSPLAEALGGALDLDQFEVQTADSTGRVAPAVVIGQQVTQDMFLRFRQQFGNQQVSQFLLEYRLANFLRLQGNVSEGDGLTAGNRSLMQRIERYGLDLVFYFAF